MPDPSLRPGSATPTRVASRLLTTAVILILLSAAPARADVISLGNMETKTDFDTFFFFPGTGHICVDVQAAGPRNQGAGTPCTIRVGNIPARGKGSDKAKRGELDTDSYSDRATDGKATSRGSGSWTYTALSSGGFFDNFSVVYRATTSIVPPLPTNYGAKATSKDPLPFTAGSDGAVEFGAVLNEMTLVVDSPVRALAGVAAEAQLDSTELFSFHIRAKTGFRRLADLDIHYRSDLGEAFDMAMLAIIEASLDLDVPGQTVGLKLPIVLYPERSLTVDPGSHSFSHGIGAISQIPEPSALLLLLAGMSVASARRRYQRPIL